MTPDKAYLLERIESFEGCWIWQRAKNNQGYGVINLGPRTVLAHRVAYEVFVGPIPDGLEIDHLCRQRDCLQPMHLEPVSHQENVWRGLASVSGLGQRTRENERIYREIMGI